MKGILAARILRRALLTGIVYMVVMSLMRIAFAWHFKPQEVSLFDLGPSYIMGIRFDLRIAGAVTLFVWILGSLPFLNPYRSAVAKKFWLWVLTVTGIVFAFFYVADFAHYAYLKQRLHASALNYLQDAAISGEMVWQSYPVVRILLVMVLFTLLLVYLIKKTHQWADGATVALSKPKKIITSVCVFLLLAFGIYGKAGQFPLRWSDAFGLGDAFSNNLALNPFQSFFSTLKMRNSTSVDIEQTKKHFSVISKYLGLENNQPLHYERMLPAVDSLAQQPTNVVLVLCESFSGYKSSMWGNPLNTTPFFQTLCNQGVFFNYCFTPEYGTAKGVWATVTGIPDVTTAKTASRNIAMVDQHTILNDFEGYEKFYFLGGSASWANIKGFLLNNIKQLNLYEGDKFKSPAVDVWGISDKNLFLEANGILKQQTKPFFAIIQTSGNHRPYTIPEEDLKEFKRVEFPVDSLRNNGFDNNDELNAFRYSDYCIQKFMEAAKNESYYNNTLFVFIGDHGILGNPGNLFNKTWIEGELTREHVPLLFYAPRSLKPQVYSGPCSQIDVLPSIAGLLGKAYTNTTLGRNLFTPSLRSDSSMYGQSAFRYNAEKNEVSLVLNNYYYEINLTNNTEKLLHLHSNDPVPVTDATNQLKVQGKELALAILQTSRYMLLNNQKK